MAGLTKVLSLAAVVAGVGAQPLTNWTLELLQAGAKEGATCIDGSPGAYYIKPGVGAEAANWILFFEGGGWCTSLADCYLRSKTKLGSSATYPISTSSWSARDLLLPDCEVNPAFCNWTTVYQPYCDGTSRASDAAPVDYEGHSLHFKGFRLLESMIRALLNPESSSSAAPSLADAKHVLISGSSAGGLTTLLHADYIADAVHTANPHAVVKAVPEVGFFIDGKSIWAGQHIMTAAFKMVADFGNITRGAREQVDASCVNSTPPRHRWKCFMAQFTYSHVSTPVFLLQSMVDEWQTSNILAPNSDYSVSVTAYPDFQPCIKNPVAGCNATQARQWTGYSTQFMSALMTSIFSTPMRSLAHNGGFITSCPIHTTAIGGLSHRITIGGVTMYQALVDWYFERHGPGGKQYWTVDVPYPGDKTCPLPTEYAAALALMLGDN